MKPMINRDQLDLFLASVSANRFLPVPPKEIMPSGVATFTRTGAEYLGHFIKMADLKPSDRILDIGCGAGRIAVPLTQYLDTYATYDGVDVVARNVQWCQHAIASVYHSFRFHHLDYKHDIFNPTGKLATTSAQLPFPDMSFDFIVLTSVLTHLDSHELTHYAAEVSRLLAPGGRCIATAHLMNRPARRELVGGLGQLAFDPSEPGPEFHASSVSPMQAVAFLEDFFLEKFLRHGLLRQDPVVYGSWSGRESTSFEDISVFARAPT